MKGSNKTTRGVTLVELLVTLVVAAIVTMIAVPAFRDLVHRNRLATTVNGFTTDLVMAKSEAVRRARDVRVSSLSGDKDWSGGWRVWVDRNGNGAFDAGTDTELKVHPALEGMELEATTNDGLIVFRSLGDVSPALTWHLCVASGEPGRTLNLTAAGRVSVRDYDCP